LRSVSGDSGRSAAAGLCLRSVSGDSGRSAAAGLCLRSVSDPTRAVREAIGREDGADRVVVTKVRDRAGGRGGCRGGCSQCYRASDWSCDRHQYETESI